MKVKIETKEVKTVINTLTVQASLSVKIINTSITTK